MKGFIHSISLALFLFWMPGSIHAQEISLAGEWRFAMDADNRGIHEKWFTHALTDNIQLPGSMTENGKGNDVSLQTQWVGSIYDSSFFFRTSMAKYRQPGNLKIPFWLTPVKHYVGAAWYQRDITIPADWSGKTISLFLERAHINTRVWINEKEIGFQNSLVAPHEYDLTAFLKPGKQTITIRIDNSIKDQNVGPDSHSVSDHTQGAWNGLVGKLLLKAAAPVHMLDAQVYPDIHQKKAIVKIKWVNTTAHAVEGKMAVVAKAYNSNKPHQTATVYLPVQLGAKDTGIATLTLQLGEAMQLWDEFNPALYNLSAVLVSGNTKNEMQLSFGMREIKAVGNKMSINGRNIHLRGDLNNCEFPLTGYAPMDVSGWRRIFSIAKAHGLNHMRFHSWCPPEAAFIAADEAGFYLQPEGPSWPNHGTSLGDGRFIDQYLYDETGRMLKAYGNHPSFCMMAAGNEPAGKNQAKYLDAYVQYWRSKDARRLYTGASVAMSWPLYPASDFMIKSGPRGLPWQNNQPESMSDYRAAIEKFSMPYVTHEMGQWCVFPDFKEIKQYTGVTRAKNFELFREDLADHGMIHQAEAFLMASGKLQALCYKQEIEKSLRTNNSAGFQLLGLQDFPGQGSAIIGVLNAHWKEKGYITANQWSRFCNATVPLCRMSKFTYSNADTLKAAIEIYHYGKADLANAVILWTLKDETGKMVKQGKFAPTNIPTGGNTDAGVLSVPLHSISKASKLILEVSIGNTPFANDWNIWVYPQAVPDIKQSVYYTDTLDAKAEAILQKGGTVFMNAAGKVRKGAEVVQYFTPVFWNTSWFKMRPPHTLGILVDTSSAAFNHFPTAYHSDMQWWEIVNRSQVMHLEDFPKGFTPLVQPIDTWFMNRKLALVLEARAGNGKIIICSADLVSDTSRRIAARQLMYSLQQYMASPKFDPKQKVDMTILKNLFISPSKETWESFTKATPDELKPAVQQKQ
ncbi:MAG TPA: glycoside hydrolase family 2 TIM barrel-domain containing protein [Phnomibacter sp.]|nr:glycoside hydrolase family 2 TIM barrel-domain containing protein [Phnomibacter sp.]